MHHSTMQINQCYAKKIVHVLFHIMELKNGLTFFKIAKFLEVAETFHLTTEHPNKVSRTLGYETVGFQHF